MVSVYLGVSPGDENLTVVVDALVGNVQLTTLTAKLPL